MQRPRKEPAPDLMIGNAEDSLPWVQKTRSQRHRRLVCAPEPGAQARPASNRQAAQPPNHEPERRLPPTPATRRAIATPALLEAMRSSARGNDPRLGRSDRQVAELDPLGAQAPARRRPGGNPSRASGKLVEPDAPREPPPKWIAPLSGATGRTRPPDTSAASIAKPGSAPKSGSRPNYAARPRTPGARRTALLLFAPYGIISLH